MQIFNYQPTCPQCGAKAKKHTQSWWETSRGKYTGNLQIIRRKDETLTLWDGESYYMYAGYFCRNRCAIDFANDIINIRRRR